LPNAILIDEQIAGFFSDVSVAAEQAELEIYNASDQIGLAYKFARQFQNIGINVVKYGNYFESADESIIYLETEQDIDRYRNTIREIQNTIGKATILIGAYQYNKSGDIIIVLN
jgi:calcineurin-like phosphoesterase